MKHIFLSFVLVAGALAAQAMEAHAAPMRFLPSTNAEEVIAEGDIDSSTVTAFNAYKNAHSGVRRVNFDSDGGSVVEALALGRAIRQAGLNTYVGGAYKVPREGFTAANLESMGECYSACVYAFAGGVNRFFDATGGVIGVHQFSGDKTATGEVTAQYLMPAIGMYLDEMGVSRTLLDWAALVAPNTIQPLPRAMAERFQLDNIGDRAAPRSPQANSPTDRSDLDQFWPMEGWRQVDSKGFEPDARFYVARGSLTKSGDAAWFTVKIIDNQGISVNRWGFDPIAGKSQIMWWYQYDLSGRFRSSHPDMNSAWTRLAAEALAAHNSMVELCYRASGQDQ